jgi:hypothetical protein
LERKRGKLRTTSAVKCSAVGTEPFQLSVQ